MSPDGPVPLEWPALAGAAALILFNAFISLWLRLGLEKTLLVATVRTTGQLLLLGYILVPVFSSNNPLLVAGIVTVMLLIATDASVRRLKRTWRGARRTAGAALLLGCGGTALYATLVLVQADPWWDPRYVIPLVGMIIGNTLNGLAVGVDRCLDELTRGRDVVELMLSRGATWWEAARPVAASSVRTGMIPILNTMSVVGLVTIPGMMTGQILGGSPPDVAARYQILIMFLIAASIALGTVSAVVLCLRSLFDSDHRLRSERIVERDA